MRTTLLITTFLLFTIINCSAKISDYYDFDYLNSNYLDMCINENNQVFLCGTSAAILQSNDNGLSWEKHSIVSNMNLIDIGFFSIDCKDQAIISVGSYGKIVYSNDRGENWELSDSITSQKLNSVVLFDSNVGIAVGDSGTIIKTVDGGKNWKYIESNITANIIISIITKSKTCFIATESGLVFKSDDYGENWEKLINLPNQFHPYNFSYSKDDKLYLYSQSGLLKSIDEGETWFDISIEKSNYSYCYYKENGNGYFVGDSLKILYTRNDTTKIKVNNPDSCLYPIGPARFSRIAFFENESGLAIGSFNTIFRTSDGGETWHLISFLCGYFHYYGSGFFVNDTTGYIGVYFENLFKTTDSGITWKPVPKLNERNSRSNIYDMYFFNENRGIYLSKKDGSWTFSTTQDGGKNIKRDTIKNFGCDVQHFKHMNNDTFFINGNRWFNNNYHFYYGFCNIEGNCWNKGSFDSTIFEGIYNDKQNNLYLYGSYLDSSKLPDKPWQYYRGIIYHSIDDGITWNRTYFDTLEKVTHLYFTDDNTGYAFGNTYFGGYDDSLVVFKTTDKGIHWNIIQSKLVLITDSLKSQNSGFYFGIDKGENVFSIDGGKTWERYSIDKRLTITQMFSTKNSLFKLSIIGMYSPFVLKFKLKDKYISVRDEEIESPMAPKAWIFKPYPNPARNTVNFEIAWDKKFSVNDLNINIYNIFGVKIYNPKIEINNKTINTGILKWYANDITNGIYFIEIEVGGYKKAQKVMIY